MAEITTAVEQDAIAESLLGEETPEQVAEQPETEQQVEQEVPEQNVEQEQLETESEETAEDWLPSEQDKVFPDDVLQRYATRYGLDEAWQANPQLKQLVIDKINSDIYLQQLQQQEQEVETEAVEEPTPAAQPQLTREQYFQNLDRVIQERTDPEVAKHFHADFLRAFGVPDAEIAKTSPQQAMAFTHTASKYMLNLVNTFMGDILREQLGPQLSQAFPGFSDMYDRSSHAMAWDRVRNSDPQFASLPAYGTKEFSSTLREAASRIPGFDEMQFTDSQGKPLPAQDNAMRKYAMLAQIASGQNVDPQLLQRAAQAGARNARRADVRRSAGNLGSGQSKAASGGSRPVNGMQSNTDLFDEETMDYYHQQHGRL